MSSLFSQTIIFFLYIVSLLIKKIQISLKILGYFKVVSKLAHGKCAIFYDVEYCLLRASQDLLNLWVKKGNKVIMHILQWYHIVYYYFIFQQSVHELHTIFFSAALFSCSFSTISWHWLSLASSSWPSNSFWCNNFCMCCQILNAIKLHVYSIISHAAACGKVNR